MLLLSFFYAFKQESLHHLSPDANGVPDVVLAVGQLSDAVVNSDAALSRSQVLLGHLHPTQRAHGETLKEMHTTDDHTIIHNKYKENKEVEEHPRFEGLKS